MKIRQAELQDVAAIAKVHVDSWRSTYLGLLPDELLAGLSYSEREESWHRILTREDESVSNLVLEDEAGKVVGFASIGPTRGENFGYEGEIYSIYLLEEAQGRGWGRALFEESCSTCRRLGFRGVMLWVLEDNPTRGFYEAMAGEYLGQREDLLRGAVVSEAAYGWQL